MERIGKYLSLALGIPGLILIFHSRTYQVQSRNEFYLGVFLGLSCAIIGLVTLEKES
jgi:membrane-associated PAP2 superfamily phosphatase